MMRLKKITVLRERVESWEKYPFNVAAINTLDEIEIKTRICFRRRLRQLLVAAGSAGAQRLGNLQREVAMVDASRAGTRKGAG